MGMIHSTERNDLSVHVLRALETYRSATGTPGLVAAVMSGSKELCRVASGWRDAASTQMVTVDDRFQAGSISKMATAVLALRAVREGRLDLYEPLVRRVPTLAPFPAMQGVSLHHLLSHTAALPLGMCLAPADLADLSALPAVPPQRRLGSEFYYSNVGYNVVGHALSHVHGMPYPDLVNIQLLQPLGMGDTFAQVGPAERAATVEGHMWPFDSRPHTVDETPVVAPWPITSLASENLISTVGDLALLASAIVRCDERVIDARSLDQMLTAHATADAFSYGYGACIYPDLPGSVFGHTGSMLGYRGVLIADRESQLVVAILSNMAGNDMAYCMGRLGVKLVQSVRAWLSADRSSGLPRLDDVEAGDLIGSSDVKRFCGAYHSQAVGVSPWLVQMGAKGLELCLPGKSVQLERRNDASFLPLDNQLGRYLLHFEMNAEGAAGFTVGDLRFQRQLPATRQPSGADEGLLRCCGVYRTNNPWMPRIEVLAVEGELYLHSADIICPLIPSSLRRSYFQLADTPELIQFSGAEPHPFATAHLSGLTFYRTSEESGLAHVIQEHKLHD